MIKKYWKATVYLMFLLIVISSFPKHLDTIYLYVPTGKYMMYLEYLLLLSLPFITWYLQKQKVVENLKEGFWNDILIHSPKVYYFFFLLFNSLLAGLFFYSFGLFMDYFPQNYKYTRYSVHVFKVDTHVKRFCKPALVTDILEHIEIRDKTYFHLYLQKTNSHKICTAKSNSRQTISRGGKVRIDVKESPWGIYVYNIP